MKRILLIGLLCFCGSVFSYKTGDKVQLVVAQGCSACHEAEEVLKLHHIQFSIKEGTGFVPRLYVNGKYVGLGTGVVDSYAIDK